GCLFTHVEPWLDTTRLEDLWWFEGAHETPERLAQSPELRGGAPSGDVRRSSPPLAAGDSRRGAALAGRGSDPARPGESPSGRRPCRLRGPCRPVRHAVALALPPGPGRRMSIPPDLKPGRFPWAARQDPDTPV